jgi:hypothetical protein
LFLASCGKGTAQSETSAESLVAETPKQVAAYVAEFPGGVGLDEFIKDNGFTGKYKRPNTLDGETTFLVAPLNPEHTVVLYRVNGFRDGYFSWGNEPPIDRAETGQALVFSGTFGEGMPEIIVIVTPGFWDDSEQAVWVWGPQRSGVDGSLILDDHFVRFPNSSSNVQSSTKIPQELVGVWFGEDETF